MTRAYRVSLGVIYDWDVEASSPDEAIDKAYSLMDRYTDLSMYNPQALGCEPIRSNSVKPCSGRGCRR